MRLRRPSHPHHHPHHHDGGDLEDHDRGLDHDLPVILSRRRTLSLLGGVGISAVAAACGADPVDNSGSTSGSTSGGGDAGSTGSGPDGPSSPDGTATTSGEIPEETAGPFPGDGSNGVNVLDESGVVRSDLRSSFGEASGVADGVPLTVVLTLLDVSGGTTAPLAGAAVYLWHADAEGRYSLYSDGVTQENYLRGVQEADGEGTITFTSVFPGCYPGRWPHLHFEVYPSLAQATSAESKMRTSQIAFPEDVCAAVYTDDRYPGSSENLARLSLETDNVFSDGYSLQLAAMAPADTGGGYTARLTVPV